jgi:hypothetical protein
MYKWQKYLFDAIANAEGRQQSQIPLGETYQMSGTETDSAQAFKKNIILAMICAMLIVEASAR